MTERKRISYRASWLSATGLTLLPVIRLVMAPPIGLNLYYSGLIIAAIAVIIYSLRRYKHTQISFLSLGLLAVCALSILFSPWAQFREWLRLVAFALLLLAVGPIVSTIRLRELRRRAFELTGWMCISVSLCYNGAYLFMVTHYCSWMSRYTYIFTYTIAVAILAGALSAIGALIFGWKLLHLTRQDLMARKQLIRTTILSLCFLSSVNAMIVASSRAAIGAFVVAWSIMCALTWRRRKRIPVAGCISATLLSAFCILTMFVPLTPNMIIKFKAIETHDNDYLASRREMWHKRTEDIQVSGLLGTGFATTGSRLTDEHKPIAQTWVNLLDVNNGIIEPGSGWLYILSSTGWLGLGLFILLFGKALLTSLRLESIWVALIIFFGIHFVTEGYVLTSGSMLSYIFWLLMGCILPGKLPLRNRTLSWIR